MGALPETAGGARASVGGAKGKRGLREGGGAGGSGLGKGKVGEAWTTGAVGKGQ